MASQDACLGTCLNVNDCVAYIFASESDSQQSNNCWPLAGYEGTMYGANRFFGVVQVRELDSELKLLTASHAITLTGRVRIHRLRKRTRTSSTCTASFIVMITRVRYFTLLSGKTIMARSLLNRVWQCFKFAHIQSFVALFSRCPSLRPGFGGQSGST